VISFGWALNPAFTRETTAHELGHNLGRRHSPCDGAPSPDPFYPYGGGVTGVVGHDVRGWMAGRAATAVVQPANFGDIMGYCAQNWISDYTYRSVLTFRGSTPAAGRGTAALRADALALARPVTRVMMVRGTVFEGREVTLNPTFAVEARPALPDATGPYRLEGRTADGRTLFSYSFAPTELDHLPGIGHFAFAIPVSPAAEAELATIDVRGPAGNAMMARGASVAALRAPPPPPLRRPADGLVTVSCADANARGILVRDASAGTLLAVERASSARIVAAAGTQVTVVCSDGVQSARTMVIAP
jgi:hypothetical protein